MNISESLSGVTSTTLDHLLGECLQTELRLHHVAFSMGNEAKSTNLVKELALVYSALLLCHDCRDEMSEARFVLGRIQNSEPITGLAWKDVESELGLISDLTIALYRREWTTFWELAHKVDTTSPLVPLLQICMENVRQRNWNVVQKACVALPVQDVCNFVGLIPDQLQTLENVKIENDFVVPDVKENDEVVSTNLSLSALTRMITSLDQV